MRDLLRGYAAATLDSAARAGHARQVTDDLAAFTRILMTSEPLRITLADAAIPPQARRGVVHDLLDGKVATETQELVSWAALVEPAAEFPVALSALEELAHATADAAEAGHARPVGAEELLGGRTAVRERIRGYADRLFQETDRPESIDELESEVVSFARVADASRELRQAIGDPTRPVAQRVGLISELLRGKVQPATARLVAYLLEAGNVRDFVGTLEWVAGLAADERGRRVAQVRSAVELDDDERRRLVDALRRTVGRPVELRVQVEPSLMGGMSVEIGDYVIDGSVRHRLDQLRESLAQSATARPLEPRP
jgi:F-type H+-transporting ATPase subunit delta